MYGFIEYQAMRVYLRHAIWTVSVTFSCQPLKLLKSCYVLNESSIQSSAMQLISCTLQFHIIYTMSSPPNCPSAR
jgi:hypothetical protein